MECDWGPINSSRESLSTVSVHGGLMRPLEGLLHVENINFLLCHLRDDLVSDDLKFSMMTSNMLYEKKFLVSTYLKIIDRKLQY